MFAGDIRGPSNSAIEARARQHLQRVERGLLRAAEHTRLHGIRAIRDEMAGAGLGRLGYAIGAKADKALHKGRGEVSASAQFFVRSRSPRSRGAVEAYTAGADIRPRRSRWLWVPTDDAQRLVGSGARRQRLTPGVWRESGMEQKLGPLVTIRSVNGLPLLAVQNIGVDLSGRKPSAKSLRKNGMPRKAQVKRTLVVMFVAIPSTSRAARVSPRAILRRVREDAKQVYYATVEGSTG